jgi:tetratricopeptide (TPR) repeat protein
MDDAVRLLNEAIVLNLEIKNELAVRNNYLTLQRINRYRGNLSEALKYNEAILTIDLNTKNNRFLAETYMDHAQILTSQKNFTEAETLVLRKALPLYYYGLKDKTAQSGVMISLPITIISRKNLHKQSGFISRRICWPER